jgi:hypothetical protein
MKDWTILAGDESIQKVVDSLKKENIEAFVVENGQAAKEKVLEIIPKGVEVMTMASQTLEVLGLNKEINESGNYDSTKSKLMKMDRATQGREMQKLGAAPEWAIGSVHAVSEDGHIFVASATGSQLGAYGFGSAHVVWVVGSQKIVKNWEEGIKRTYEYSLVKESERQIANGNPNGSYIGKLLIINKEFKPGRTTLIIVKENLGF